MKTIKTAELSGAALDWSVAKADSHRVAFQSGHLYLVDEKQRRIAAWKPSAAWAQGGPIIEREHICPDWLGTEWCARHFVELQIDPEFADERGIACKRITYGPAPLIAAMRCFVASKLGDSIEVPEELCN